MTPMPDLDEVARSCLTGLSHDLVVAGPGLSIPSLGPDEERFPGRT